MHFAPWLGLAAICFFVACSGERDDPPDGRGGAASDTMMAGSGGAGGGSPAGVGGGGAGGSGCDPELARANKALVGQALDELLVDKDVTAVDRYWADPYLRHHPGAPSDLAAFRTLMSYEVASLGFGYERLRTLAECDLVVVHGRYSDAGVIFDMYRVKDDKIVEHWDSNTAEASDAAGPTEIEDEALTAQNRELALSFIDAVLVDGEHARVSEFLDASYVEHRYATATGPAALIEYVERDYLTYYKVHHVVADGNFVFTLSEVSRGGGAYGIYDLFRVDDGAIVEHWDSRRIVPASTDSELPIF
ncbi:nuclear transport factor 2 family protein [Sorangium sp. So ce327]|uniref:nuclear transport factor 2 family protein n=1 Tax=Sorangium sp. So ce327 TaxID=3133301 RepID=UPI003F63DD37